MVERHKKTHSYIYIYMNQIFTLAIITILYKLIRYIYKVYTFDCSELYKYIENTDKQTIFAAYGHTSFFDVPYIIRASYILLIKIQKIHVN